MKYPKTLTLAFLLSLSTLNLAAAQSNAADDPLSGFDELFDALKEIESAEEPMDLGGSDNSTLNAIETETSSEATDKEESSQTENSTTEDTVAAKSSARLIQNRLMPKTVPEGKENFVLYRVPGAFEYRGMTFTRLESSLFYNRFQRCDTTKDEVITNTLAKLKISQGAPLECRETMKYKFAPYRSFRASR